jgi:hypothetical protein
MVNKIDDTPARRYLMRKSVLVLVGCLVLSAAPTWAGGAFSLFGTYGEVTPVDRSFGVGARGSVGGDRLVVDLTATWFPSRTGTVVDKDGFVIQDELQIIPFDLGLRYVFAPGSDLRPYIGAGVSYVLINLSEGTADDETGYYALAGLIFQTGASSGFFGEVLYRNAEATVSYDGVDYDRNFGGIAGSLGIFWTF